MCSCVHGKVRARSSRIDPVGRAHEIMFCTNIAMVVSAFSTPVSRHNINVFQCSNRSESNEWRQGLLCLVMFTDLPFFVWRQRIGWLCEHPLYPGPENNGHLHNNYMLTVCNGQWWRTTRTINRALGSTATTIVIIITRLCSLPANGQWSPVLAQYTFSTLPENELLYSLFSLLSCKFYIRCLWS